MQTPARKSTCYWSAGIVLAFLAAAGGVLLVLPRVTEEDRARRTAVRLDSAATTLEHYARLTGDLPCPADPTLAPNTPRYGEADCSTACRTVGGLSSGRLPTRTLQLADDTGTDGFGRNMLYLVQTRLPARDKGNRTGERDDGAVLAASGNEGAEAAAFALVSAGPDRRFGAAPDAAAGETDPAGCTQGVDIPAAFGRKPGDAGSDDDHRHGGWIKTNSTEE